MQNAAGIIIIRNEPAAPMISEAKSSGQLKPKHFNPFDHLQIVTVHQILDGAKEFSFINSSVNKST